MFELTKSQKGIKKAARDFAKGEFDKEAAYEMEKNSLSPVDIRLKAADLGFIGIHFPEIYSGSGLGRVENTLVYEELCTNDPSIGISLANSFAGSETLEKYGAESLKEHYLTAVCEGTKLSALALWENGIFNDFSGISCHAEKTPRSWVISGKKPFVKNASLADFYLVLCKTENNEKPEKNLSLFLVDKNVEGISIEDNSRMLGGNMTPAGNLIFKQVSLPHQYLIGEPGKGFQYLENQILESMILTSALALGTASAALNRVKDHIKGREQFGQKISTFQVTRHKIADMATKIELSRFITYQAAWLMDQKKTDKRLCSMAKIKACRTAMEVGAQTIQLFGGYGFMTEYDVERFYREAKCLEARDGGWNYHKDFIADIIIGRNK